MCGSEHLINISTELKASFLLEVGYISWACRQTDCRRIDFSKLSVCDLKFYIKDQNEVVCPYSDL